MQKYQYIRVSSDLRFCFDAWVPTAAFWVPTDTPSAPPLLRKVCTLKVVK